MCREELQGAVGTNLPKTLQQEQTEDQGGRPTEQWRRPAWASKGGPGRAGAGAKTGQLMPCSQVMSLDLF